MRISIVNFDGEKPIIKDHLLPTNAASRSLNAVKEGVSLVPIKAVNPDCFITPVNGARSFALMKDLSDIQGRAVEAFGDGSGAVQVLAQEDEKVFSAGDIRAFVRNPLSADAYYRWYMAGSYGTPTVYYYLDGQWRAKALGVINLSGVGANVPSDGQMYVVDYDENGDFYEETALTQGVIDDLTDNAVYCSYFITGITNLGEEGIPSDPSEVFYRFDITSDVPLDSFAGLAGHTQVFEFKININLDQSVMLDQHIETIRLYRTEGEDTYNFVADIPKADFAAHWDTTKGLYALPYTDTVKSNGLGEACPSSDYNPPEASMVWMTNAGNGVMAGFFGNTLCFSEPYQPHAWPIEYQYTLSDDKGLVNIVQIARTSGYLVVTTTARPYLFYGDDPGAMSQIDIDLDLPCVSQTGLVDMGDYVLYPTHEGLALLSSEQAEVATRGVISKDDWQAMKPGTFVALRYRNDYLCFHEGGGFVYSLESGFFPIDTSFGRVYSGYYNPEDDLLWLLIDPAPGADEVTTAPQGGGNISFAASSYAVTVDVDSSGGTGQLSFYDTSPFVQVEVGIASTGSRIVLFDAFDQPAPMLWESKQFILPGSAVISCVRIEADQAVTMTLFDDGSYLAAREVTDDMAFRLPPGRPRKIRVRLESLGPIHSITLASSMQEILP